MKIITEQPLRDFQFWSGAKDNAKELTYEQWDELESMLDDIYPDGLTDTPFQFAPATLAAIETTLLNPLNKELIPLTTKLTPFSIFEIT